METPTTKTKFLPQFIRRIKTAECTILALGLLAAASGQAQAQDATEPLPPDVQQLQVTLTSGHTVTLKYALSGGNLFYFPVLGLKMVELIDPSGRAVYFASTNGSLQIPGTLPSGRLCVTLFDYMKNVAAQNEILNLLRTHPLIVASPPGPLPRSAAMQPERTARLVLSDAAGGNQRRVLATSLLTDADANAEPKASFHLSSEGLAALRGAGNARFINIEIEESYRARFYTNDVIVTLNVASQSLAFTMLRLHASPDLGRPGFLLSSRLPTAIPPGGSIERDVDFTSRVGSECRLTIYTRPGSSADPQLVQTLVNAALERSRLQMLIEQQERERAVATVLLPDGFSLTLPLGHLSEIAADMRLDRERKWSSAFTHASRNSGAVYVNTDFGVNVLGIFGGNGSVDTAVLWDNSDYVNQRRSEYSRKLEEMSARLTGNIPVITGMRITDSGSVTNIHFDELQGVIGTFTVGLASLANRRIFMEYFATLDGARRVEALLVPQMDVGVLNVGSSENWTRSGTSLYKDVTVTFSKRFASIPKVIASISRIDSDARPNYIRLRTEVRNVTFTGFTLRFSSAYDGQTAWIYNSSASWIAIGEGRLERIDGGELAGIGTPGYLPLIPGEIREGVLTPTLQAPQSANGRLTGMFNAIPGRTYLVESSLNLLEWSPLGATLADDFDAGFDVPILASIPQQFFRVTPQ